MLIHVYGWTNESLVIFIVPSSSSAFPSFFFLLFFFPVLVPHGRQGNHCLFFFLFSFPINNHCPLFLVFDNSLTMGEGIGSMGSLTPGLKLNHSQMWLPFGGKSLPLCLMPRPPSSSYQDPDWFMGWAAPPSWQGLCLRDLLTLLEYSDTLIMMSFYL